MNTDYRAVAESGVAALRRGDAAAARAAFNRVEAAGRGSHQLRLLLAQACMLVDDRPGATAALERVIATSRPTSTPSSCAATCSPRKGTIAGAVSWYNTALAQAPRAGKLPPDLIERLRGAEAACLRAKAAFETHLERALDGDTDAGPRFREAREILAGRAQPQLQQPTSFYYPGLPQQAFYEREEFAWVPALEAAAPAIRGRAGGDPRGRSGSRPLCRARSQPADQAACAARRPAVGRVPPAAAGRAGRRPRRPLPGNDGGTRGDTDAPDRRPLTDGAVLGPPSRNPHPAAQRDAQHPADLPFAADRATRLPAEGRKSCSTVERDRTMIFDDSIEHEAWNDGDAVRVVLLFEVWRPELDPRERAALRRLFEAISAYAPFGEDQGGA
jgi:hypothetical protein